LDPSSEGIGVLAAALRQYSRAHLRAVVDLVLESKALEQQHWNDLQAQPLVSHRFDGNRWPQVRHKRAAEQLSERAVGVLERRRQLNDGVGAAGGSNQLLQELAHGRHTAVWLQAI
jgi:hypothetical protein